LNRGDFLHALEDVDAVMICFDVGSSKSKEESNSSITATTTASSPTTVTTSPSLMDYESLAPSTWTTANVLSWLNRFSFASALVSSFAKDDIDGATLLMCDKEVLKDSGLTNSLHITKLVSEIAKLKIRDEAMKLKPNNRVEEKTEKKKDVELDMKTLFDQGISNIVRLIKQSPIDRLVFVSSATLSTETKLTAIKSSR